MLEPAHFLIFSFQWKNILFLEINFLRAGLHAANESELMNSTLLQRELIPVRSFWRLVAWPGS